MSRGEGPHGPWHQFTAAGLKAGQPDHQQVAAWVAEWIDRLEQGDTVDELLDRLDGTPWSMPDGSWATVDLGTSITTPEYRRLRAIVREVRRELA